MGQALDDAGIPYRNEQKLQDLAAEPLAKLLVAYLETLAGVRNPASYVRLHRGRLFDSQSEDEHFRLRTAWDAHLQHTRAFVESSGSDLSDRHLLDELTAGFLSFFGDPAIAALHPDYESLARVEEIVKDVTDRIEEVLADNDADAESLARFADERGLRVMSIHKSKGLEFDAVAVMAVEHEMFFGNPDEARAAFFVGISRARHHLLLTHARTRRRPPPARRWDVYRTPYQEFFDYGLEPSTQPP
ncbi:MAG TPA: 3'-5' exonuclease [Streptosporangiaceae bacterium]|nr:3'-5' exonuclease [Streptosporangiaceae bacterium]